MSDRLTPLQVLVAIVDSGGFARAAERLAMSPTMVSTHLARLESRLGTRLIHRSTRRFTLTAEGHMLVAEARALLHSLDAAEEAVRRGRAGPSGRVRIEAPGALGLRFIAPALPRFRAAYPHIVLDVNVSDRTGSERPQAMDLMVRVGLPLDGKSEVLRLGQTRFVQVASPEYLARRGAPERPEDLLEHETVVYTTTDRPIGLWRFVRGEERRAMRLTGVATFNHGDAITSAVVAGLGIAQTLELLVAPELEAGALVQVLPDWNADPVDIQLLFAPDRRNRPAVRAVIDFLRSEVDWRG